MMESPVVLRSRVPENDFRQFDHDLHELRIECHLDEVSIQCVEQNFSPLS